jgi:hypothetical protein
VAMHCDVLRWPPLQLVPQCHPSSPPLPSPSLSLPRPRAGGKTWKSLFYKLNWAYFNGIDWCVLGLPACRMSYLVT